MPESMMPILIPAPAFAAPPTALHAVCALTSPAARSRSGFRTGSCTTCATPGMSRSGERGFPGRRDEDRIHQYLSGAVDTDLAALQFGHHAALRRFDARQVGPRYGLFRATRESNL